MTLSTTLARTSYDGDGGTTNFPTGFKFFENGHVRVVHVNSAGSESDWSENMHFTLSGAGNDSGGTVSVLTSPVDYTPLSGERIVILRDVPELQETSYPESGAFPAGSHERALDLLTMLVQQHSVRHDRSLAFSDGDDSTAIGDLPPAIERQNRFLGFDGDGKPIAVAGTSANLGPVSAFMDTLLDDADADSARATLGITAGLRNKAINGNFDIWQRADSAGPGGLNGFVADRWGVVSNGGTVVRRQFTPGQGVVPGEPANYFEYIQNDDTGTPIIFHRMESVRTLAAETATVSFYGKADTAKSVPGSLQQNFGTGGTPSAPVETPLGSFSFTTNWQKFVATVTLPSIAGQTIGTDANDYLQFHLGTAGLGGFTLNLSQVQIEQGSSASAFEPRHLAAELSLCQRYYCHTFAKGIQPQDGSGNSSGALFGYFTTSLIPHARWQFPVPMARVPSITLYNIRVGGLAGQWSNAAVDLADARAVNINRNAAHIDNSGTGASGNGFWYVHAAANGEL